MYWIVFAINNNEIQHIQLFMDYEEAKNYTDSYIQHINSNIVDFPNYYNGEAYKQDNWNIGIFLQHM